MSAPDWEKIATELAQRLLWVIEYGDKGMVLDTKTCATRNVKEYLADGLEMMPGMKIDRELMHMTRAQRAKAIKARAAQKQEAA